jgi:tubulin monoglycylase TTLL3/8
VNTNPCLETPCPLLSWIINTLVENVFKVCLDPLFPPPNQFKSKKFNIPEEVYKNNKFEIIFDLKYEESQ